MGQLRHWTCQKGGLPDRFESKVAAHAIADIGSNVTKAQKRVRLPPFLIPVTHLHFSFPSRRESLHLFPPLVVALSTVASPKEPESMENEAISPEPNKRNQTIGFSSKKSPNVNDFAYRTLETGYRGESLMWSRSAPRSRKKRSLIRRWKAEIVYFPCST